MTWFGTMRLISGDCQSVGFETQSAKGDQSPLACATADMPPTRVTSARACFNRRLLATGTSGIQLCGFPMGSGSPVAFSRMRRSASAPGLIAG